MSWTKSTTMFRITVIIKGFRVPTFFVEAIDEEHAIGQARNVVDPQHSEAVQVRAEVMPETGTGDDECTDPTCQVWH